MMREPYQPLDQFRSPETPVDAVPIDSLTRSQRRLLLIYHEHREQPFRLAPLLRRLLPFWCLKAMLLSACVAVVWWALYELAPHHAWDFGFLAAGLLFGSISRDVAYSRQVVALWPVLREIIDWNKVAARLDAGK